MMSVAGAILAVMGLGFVCTGALLLSKLFHKKKSVWPPLPSSARLPDLSFLTQRLGGATYRYEDFVEDLKNPSIAIELIIAKCGGKISPEWEKRIVAAPGPMESPVLPDPDGRAKARRDWFAQASAHTKILKVVPPPPVPQAVPTIKAWVVHCKFCAPNNGAYLNSGRDRYNPNHCRWCGNTGFVTITGG